MEPMTWIALAGLALGAMQQMNQGDKKKEGGASAALPALAPFNAQPMMTGDSGDDATARALRGADWLQAPADFGGEGAQAMVEALRRGGQNNDFSIYA